MGVRAERRETTQRAVLTAGLRLLADGGSDALTVRGLARELDLVPSALYRYVANRDDLLTMLVAHAHGDLADTVQDAHDRVRATDLHGRWRAIAHAIRDWASAHPHEFALIFGTPVPGYHAPAERTTEPGTRVHLLLAHLGADAAAAGRRPPAADSYRDAAERALPAVQTFLAADGVTLGPEWILAGLAAWHLVMGAVISERFGHLGESVEPDAYFDGIVRIGERILLGPACTL
ncbi:TetR/AcrR family transcriptional regulator [Propionicicella superfundia]|uniref:TetR/AcrR family transcriptional regulator n=1 Tax=Propionicicella superfundia TaxID=348582 RepID=UPI00048EF3B6|nr:TetR/AcrR family transcriptional regulator [Propionicicella superfundia]